MPDTVWTTLANVGVAGIVLGWFMFVVTPQLKGIESAIDRMSRAILILVIEMASSSVGAKTQAQTIIDEIKTAAHERKEIK